MSTAAYEQNRKEYDRLKRDGALTLGTWVVVANGRLQGSFTVEQEALKYMYTNYVYNTYFVQVGNEEAVDEID